MKSFKQHLEACWDGYRQVGMKKKGNRMVPNCVPESFDMREANEGSQITVGDYTTKHFDICPSAVALYSKIKGMTVMVHLIVENMMLQDLFFRLEKQAIAQGLIDDDDLDKAGDYADMIMDNARQMGLEKEHSYINDVHMKRFMELAGLDDSEEDLEEAEGSVKRNRELLSTGRISKDEFDRRMGYGKYKKSKDPSNKRLDGPGGLYKNLVKRMGEKAELDEAALLGPQGKINRAASADQSDREYAHQMMFKGKWKNDNPGKKWPGYEKAGYKHPGYKTEETELDEGILKSYHSIASKPWSQSVKDMKGTAGEYSQIAKGKDFTVWTGYSGSLKKQAHYIVRNDKIIGSGWTMNAALKDAGLKDSDLTARSKFAQGSILNKGMKESEELEEGSESWEAGYKRRVVKTTDPEHKEKGMNWRIKGKDRPEISIKLYKEKPSQAEFNKQMRRVAGHEFGG